MYLNNKILKHCTYTTFSVSLQIVPFKIHYFEHTTLERNK